MIIREAEPSDAAMLAEVHVDSRRTAYRDILPQEYLASLSYREWADFWQDVLDDPKPETHIFVAQDEPGWIVGFAYGGPPQEETAEESEVYAIYLAENSQGQGLGRRLMNALVDKLAENGAASLMLWCFEQNQIARRFYASLGGETTEERQTERAGVPVTEIAYRWRHITALRQALAAPRRAT